MSAETPSADGDLGPASDLRSCVRFSRRGEPCTNLTDHVDRWCRQPGCDGYRRASTETAPEQSVRKMVGTKRHLETAEQRRPKGLDADDDTSTVRISRKAIESFRFQHGGSDEEARAELAMMLEDFSLQSIGTTNSGGFLSMTRQGFTIVLSPDRDVLVNYTTVHRERTWTQVQAGVKSRFGATRLKGPRREPGPPLELDDPGQLLGYLRENPPQVSGSTYKQTARVLGLSSKLTDDEVAAIEAELAADLAAGPADDDPSGPSPAVVKLETGAWSIGGRMVRWLVAEDGGAIIGSRAVDAPEQSSSESVD